MKLRRPLFILIAVAAVGSSALAQTSAPPSSSARPSPSSTTPKPSSYPPEDKITEGYTKVVSTLDGAKSFYTIWRRNKDQQLLAALPKDYAKQKHYIALTLASGSDYAGLQAGEAYVYWRLYGKRLALVEPNLDIRSTGDNESKASVKRLFTDKVLLDVPILGFQRAGGPIIDLDALLVDHADKFFGSQAKGLKKALLSIKTAKAFPENVEVGLEIPTSRGQLRTFHYSISNIKENRDYKPRKADERVGFFTTTYADFGKFKENESVVRFINRWHLEKADKSLKLSPPKQPIVFYIEHTTPIRYRRWVRKGVLMWNKAFEKVGLIDAIEVRQQDAITKAHMEKDPEDVRYNFVRWLNNGIGTAIGPSRVNPLTGQILDADIILTDGWIRHFWMQYNEILPEIAMEGYSPETLSWLHQNPKWDPRVRMAAPAVRNSIIARRAREPMPPMGGHAFGKGSSEMMGHQEFDGLAGRSTQKNGLCMAANCKTHGIALKQMMMAVKQAGEATPEKEDENEKDKDDDKKKPEEKEEVDENKEQMIDGIPESFIGPLLADLVAHEVGHTIGLRHNFKASAAYTLEEINSTKIAGKKPFTASVMDYIPVNINMNTGTVQGDYGMIEVGPYDEWAIEYGYTMKTDLKPILRRSAEPQLAYATDEDTFGPDPLARRYDFSAEPLTYAESQMRLVKKNRAEILDKFVQDGDSWSKARRGYLLTLMLQTRSLSMMSNWIGGTHVNRGRKGDPNGKAPIEVVSADRQRKALSFVLKNGFSDEAYGLTPELLKYMTIDKWWDTAHGGRSTMMENPAWNLHDKILGIQASLLTSLMRPSKLEQIYDNEFRVPADQDAFTIPELLKKTKEGIWGNLDAATKANGGKFTVRKPMISSLRRNLQAEYVDRLIDLADPESGLSVGERPIQDLSALQLTDLAEEIAKVKGNGAIDPYSRAHLLETHKRITKALDASFVVEVGG